MKRLWRNSLVFKFFLTYLAVVALLFASFYFYSSSLVEHFYISALGGRMELEARLVSKAFSWPGDAAPLDGLSRRLAQELDARITIIGTDGQVHGDSIEPMGRMENQLLRPEVAQAIATGSGSAIRQEAGVNGKLLYRAFLLGDVADRRIVRIGMSLADIDEITASLRHSLLLGLLALSAFGLLLAYAFSRHLTERVRRLVEFARQVAGGSFPKGFFGRSGHDEINLLEQQLSEMSLKIQNNVQQVIEEKEKANSILRCMTEGVLVLDPKGRVLVINGQAAKMFRLPSDRKIYGASIMELSRHPEMRTTIREVLAFDFSQDCYSKEIELHEGEWFRVNAASLRNDQSGADGSILVFHDVSELKKLENLRSDFVANVSHELRTPLTAIRGYVETLLQNPPSDPADTRYFLDIIEKHSERLSRLTEDLLTLSDLESGKIHLDLQSLDSGRVVQSVLEMFWTQAKKKEIHLGSVVEPGLPRIIGDFDRLQQLFINLVDNAVKYTPVKGTVTLQVRRTMMRQRGAAIEISVADSGPGIPEKEIPRITERFYRVDKARSRDLGGTGLGLAIVKHIAQAHGAELKIESLVQKGTTVRVLLPIAGIEDDADQRAVNE